MIIQFSVKNYKTFKEEAKLSFVASNYDKDTREGDNISLVDKYKLRLLKSAVLFGSNASGKSKFIDAIIFMQRFVLNSSKDMQKGEPIDIEPFRLNSETIKKASEFELIFILSESQYRYGFEVDGEKIIAEWLYLKEKTKEIELFYRENQNVIYDNEKLPRAKVLVTEKIVRDNALFLSVLAQFNDEKSESILNWFNELKAISGLNEETYINDTMKLSKDIFQKNRILSFLKKADIGIDNFKLKKYVLEKLKIDKVKKKNSFGDVSFNNAVAKFLKASDEYMKKRDLEDEYFSDVITFHKQYDSKGKEIDTVEFSLKQDESSGTRKYFALIGQIIKALDSGTVLFVDELDSKLHPNLVCKIVALFNSKITNPNNAQLVFNTHDTNLLSSGLFRRDQIWFIQKDKFGAANLFSLADFKTDEVRKNEAFEENYVRGKYGAIPYLGEFEDFSFSTSKKKN
jgi:AAA15 family ATPase/GTPase